MVIPLPVFVLGQWPKNIYTHKLTLGVTMLGLIWLHVFVLVGQAKYSLRVWLFIHSAKPLSQI